MGHLRVNLTPNQSRIAYDVVVSLVAAIFSTGFSEFVLHAPFNGWLFLTPALLVFFNWCFGIFSRFRVGSGYVKTPILTMSILLSSCIVYFLSRESSSIVLWASMVWAPIVLPRIFLNFNTRLKTNFIASTIRQKGPVLVVGGGGYIGSHVVEQLLHARYPVRVLDRFIYGAGPLDEFKNQSRLEIIEGDVTDIMKLTDAMSGVSAVIHLAGLVGDPACAVDESYTRHANIIATRMLKEVAISLGVPRFIFASSCSVYGASEHEVDETSKVNPLSLYARTKVDSELELLSCVDETFCVTILRFATVFGYSRRPRFDLVANLFTAQSLIDGTITVTGEHQWRPFVHVQDIAHAIVRVLRASQTLVAGQVFNVGDSRLNVTIGDLARKIQAIVNLERKTEVIFQGDVLDKRSYFVSFKKIQRVLGFEASLSIEDGVREIVNEIKENPFFDYRNTVYSNVAMTHKTVEDFRDPLQSSRLYHPLGDEKVAELPRVANIS